MTRPPEQPKPQELGFCEGDTCNRGGCLGIINTAPAKDCSCHINAPCGACTDPRSYCDVCNWQQKNDPIETHSQTQEQIDGYSKWYDSLVAAHNRPLDPTKIDYKIRAHTHFSQICEGVYPEGTSMEEVQKLVKGTFGGRFDYFGNGRFKYIAYTD